MTLTPLYGVSHFFTGKTTAHRFSLHCARLICLHAHYREALVFFLFRKSFLGRPLSLPNWSRHIFISNLVLFKRVTGLLYCRRSFCSQRKQGWTLPSSGGMKAFVFDCASLFWWRVFYISFHTGMSLSSMCHRVRFVSIKAFSSLSTHSAYAVIISIATLSRNTWARYLFTVSGLIAALSYILSRRSRRRVRWIIYWLTTFTTVEFSSLLSHFIYFSCDFYVIASLGLTVTFSRDVVVLIFTVVFLSAYWQEFVCNGALSSILLTW